MARILYVLRGVGDVPAGDGWLADAERTVQAGLTVDSRRRDWRLGRWAAKGAARAWLVAAGAEEPEGAPREVELAVLAGDDGAPEVWRQGERAACALSISHRGGLAVAAVAAAGTELGCDLELVEPRSDAFVADYFTAAEAERLTDAPSVARPLLANLIWSAKESALKAARQGLKRDTRSVEVSLPSLSRLAGWSPLEVRDRERGRSLSGWWRTRRDHLLTVVADPAPDPPEACR